ncbi:MAG: hypothetical protein J5780_05495 [Treponema sp.]|nr:hypothetical protein [Treponema sp.]
MAESSELTKIERELVLQYLRDDNVPLTVTLEEKPEKPEASLVENKADSSEENRIPASAVFPVAIKSEQIRVLDQGIILLKNSARSVLPFLGKKVRVQFYFNHVGLYFVTEMKEYSKGLAIVVPLSIKRIKTASLKNEYDFTAVISYKDRKGSDVKINCVPSLDFPLFVVPVWAQIKEESRKKAKELLERYVVQVKDKAACAVGNGVHLLSVVRFLTEENAAVTAEVDNLVPPLKVLYVDDKRIVLAGGKEAAFIQEGEPYSLEMSFMLASNRLIKRTINVDVTLESVYEYSEGRSEKCYSCLFKDMKMEDLRYLYERISGVKVA